MHELLTVLCRLTGDNSWYKKKDASVADNTNSLIARIMMKIRDAEDQQLIGGRKLVELKSTLRALSPLAKLWLQEICHRHIRRHELS